MKITKEEMETILVMYGIVCCEGQESGTMVNLVERIKKEKKKNREWGKKWDARE